MKIWKFTGSKPNMEITSKIEKDWIKNVLNRKNEKRFSICVKDTNQYIGNVQLTSIKNKKCIKDKENTILVLAWNFFNEIKKNNKDLSNNFINIKDLESTNWK